MLNPLPSDLEDKARQIARMDALLCKRNRLWKDNRIERGRRAWSELYGNDYCRAWEHLPKSAAEPFTEQTFIALHALLIPHVPLGYKKNDNLILKRENGIVNGIFFIPPGAEETPQAMTALTDAYRQWEQSGGLPALATLGCFLLDFLCIHPFSDGNGRTTRLLLVLLLLRMGFPGAVYLDAESYLHIPCHRVAMVKAQRSSMQGWYEGQNDYRPIAEFWLETVLELYKEAAEDI